MNGTSSSPIRPFLTNSRLFTVAIITRCALYPQEAGLFPAWTALDLERGFWEFWLLPPKKTTPKLSNLKQKFIAIFMFPWDDLAQLSDFLLSVAHEIAVVCWLGCSISNLSNSGCLRWLTHRTRVDVGCWLESQLCC